MWGGEDFELDFGGIDGGRSWLGCWLKVVQGGSKVWEVEIFENGEFEGGSDWIFVERVERRWWLKNGSSFCISWIL